MESLRYWCISFLFMISTISSQCPEYQFGQICQYQCRCLYDDIRCAQKFGNCSGNNCLPEWFGPKCQRKKLRPESTGMPTLTDGNPLSCTTLVRNSDMYMYITLQNHYVITWIRVYLQNTDVGLQNLLISVDDRSNGNDQGVPRRTFCNATNSVQRGNILDVYCHPPAFGKWVNIELQEDSQAQSITVCEIEVSSGRNVALRQPSNQSSVYIGGSGAYLDFGTYVFRADFAVDGNPNPDFTQISCTHTLVETNPWWYVVLENVMLVKRIVVFNRNGVNYDRLRGFHILIKNREGKYTVLYENTKLEYNSPQIDIVVNPPVLTDTVRIKIPGEKKTLTLCEVQVYGECPDGFYGFDCSTRCNCFDQMEVCEKMVGSCASGCPAGKTGLDCYQDCTDGFYGKNCENMCSESCYSTRTCNAINGFCHGGCVSGFMPPLCDKDCEGGFFGENCTRRCRCADESESCNKITGKCQSGCQIGFLPPLCEECPMGYYGSSCSINCSSFCDGGEGTKQCHHQSGACLLGCINGYQLPRCTEIESTQMTTVIVIVVVLIVLVAVALSLMVYFIRKRKEETVNKLQTVEMSGNVTAKHHVDTNNIYLNHNIVQDATNVIKANVEVETDDELEVDTITITSPIDAVYYNAVVTNTIDTSIHIDRLGFVLFEQQQTNQDHLREQFKALASGLTAPVKIALNPYNKAKNRYKNICAYDHTRVVLSVVNGDPNTDYINASYIDGYKEERAYIASQGPTKAILNDFVRMLWDTSVNKVVMLTNLMEGGKQKCHQYWPTEGSKTFGDITVQLQNSIKTAHYIIRKLELSKGGGNTKILHQFHFTSWPDKDVPDTPFTLIEFLTVVKQTEVQSKGPVLVHCSAGIGRTGTYIALDYLLDQVITEKEISFYECVKRLRAQRTQMIQTYSQYRFVHEAVYLAYYTHNTKWSLLTFKDQYLKSLYTPDSSGEHQLEKTFKLIDGYAKYKVSSNENDKNSKSAENSSRKNTMGTFYSSYSTKDRFIVTRTPAADKVADFWKLVSNFNVKMIIDLEPQVEHNEYVLCLYPTHNQVIEFSSFKITHLKSTDTKHQISLQKNGNTSDEKIITVLEDNILDNDGFLQTNKLSSIIHSVIDQPKESPVLVYCRNGSKYSGLFCVLYNIIEQTQLLMKGVSIPYTVGMLKSVHPDVIPQLNQYIFCYEFVKNELDSSGVYSNLPSRSSSIVTEAQEEDSHVYSNT